MPASTSRPDPLRSWLDRLAPGAVLRGARLAGGALARRDLRGVVLADADLRGADLSGADLSGAILTDADLDGARLAGARLPGADLSRARAPDADAPGVDLSEARLTGGEWRRARLDGGCLDGVHGLGLRLDGASLRGATLRRAALHRAVLDDSLLEGADLTRAGLKRAAVVCARGRFSWEGADLAGADLRGLDAAALGQADLALVGARVDPAVAAELEEVLRARGWTPGPWMRLRLSWARAPAPAPVSETEGTPPEPTEAPSLEDVPARVRVEDRARAELRALARRRALEARASAGQGAERLAAMGGILAQNLSGWRAAVLGRDEEEAPLRAVDAGLDFETEAIAREGMIAEERREVDQAARIAVRQARLEAQLAVERGARRARGSEQLAAERAARASELSRMQALDRPKVVPRPEPQPTAADPGPGGAVRALADRVASGMEGLGDRVEVAGRPLGVGSGRLGRLATVATGWLLAGIGRVGGLALNVLAVVIGGTGRLASVLWARVLQPAGRVAGRGLGAAWRGSRELARRAWSAVAPVLGARLQSAATGFAQAVSGAARATYADVAGLGRAGVDGVRALPGAVRGVSASVARFLRRRWSGTGLMLRGFAARLRALALRARDRLRPVWRSLMGPGAAEQAALFAEDAQEFRVEAANRERALAARRLVQETAARRSVRLAREVAARERSRVGQRKRELEVERAARRAELARLEREAGLRADWPDWAQKAKEDLERKQAEVARLERERPEDAVPPAAGPAWLPGWVADRLPKVARVEGSPAATDAETAGSVGEPGATEAASILALRVSLQGRVLTGVRRLREVLPRALGDTLPLGPGADLRERQLDDRDLSGLNLAGALLSGAGLVGADLRGTDLRGADLSGADLTAARLQGARLDGALLNRCEFDQAELAGTSFEGATVTGARFAQARGLDPETRADLARRGADLGLREDAVGVRVAGWAMAMSIFLVIGVYLGARFSQREQLDAAALEHAATLAQQGGDPATAAERFRELAEKARDDEGRVTNLLESAAAWTDAGDYSKALTTLDEALEAAKLTALEGRVILRRAQVEASSGLAEAALRDFRAVLLRSDLTPGEQGAALVGLAALLPEEDRAEVDATEASLLAAAATDPQRSALGMALADAWAAEGRVDLARAAMGRALAAVDAIEEQVPMRMRLARLQADEGDTDGALAAYRELIALPDEAGAEARLGAAELLARRGADEEADAMLDALRATGDEDLAARADLTAATIARRRGDLDSAVAALRRVLDASNVEARLQEEARLELARVLVRADPDAAAQMADASPSLRDEIRLGQARALREAGERADARALWVELADDPAVATEIKVEAQLSLADIEVEEGDVDGALRRYESMMTQTTSVPQRQRIQLGAASALVRGGRVQEAEARYLALLGAGRGEIADQCRLGLARTAELRGTLVEATRLYEEVGRSQGPWALEALLALGAMRERGGDFDGAAEAYRLALTRPGAEAQRRADVQIALARALQEGGDPSAAAVYASLLDANDATVRVAARLAVADGLMLEGEATRARALYEEALAESAPGEPRARARGGWLRATVALGLVQEGMDRIEAWLETEVDDQLRGELAVAAVRALRSEGRSADAIRIAERYAADGGFELGMEHAGALRESGQPAEAAALIEGLAPASAEDEAWRSETRADALLEAGRLAAAQSAYEALALVPGGAAAAQLGQARVAREKGAYEEALELLVDCADPRAPIERANVLEALERWDEAETAWGALALAPDLETRSAGTLGLARARNGRDDPAGALRILDGLPAVDAGYALTFAQVRGESLLALGRVAEAREVYAALDGDAEARVVSLLGRGECSLAEDDPAAATTSFTAALEATEDPFYAALALSGLARSRTAAGDPAGARVHLERLRREHPDRTDLIAALEGGSGG